MLKSPRSPYKERMSVIQYSPHPAAFYTVKTEGRVAGLGSGPCATDPGLWNIVYLTLAQTDEYEAEHIHTDKMGTWTPAFLKPFADTAAFELSGTAIGDLATMLHAKGFVDYLLSHPDRASIPLVVAYGTGVLATMRGRAMKAVNINSGEVARPADVTVYEPADADRAKITSMGDWAANLVKGHLH